VPFKTIRIDGSEFPTNCLGEGSCIIEGGVSLDGNQFMKGDLHVNGKIYVCGKEHGGGSDDGSMPMINDLTRCKTSISPDTSDLTLGRSDNKWSAVYTNNINDCITVENERYCVPFKICFTNPIEAHACDFTALSMVKPFNESAIDHNDAKAIFCQFVDGVEYNLTLNGAVRIQIEQTACGYEFLRRIVFAKPFIYHGIQYGWCLYYDDNITKPIVCRVPKPSCITEKCGKVCIDQQKRIQIYNEQGRSIWINHTLEIGTNECSSKKKFVCQDKLVVNDNLVLNQDRNARIEFVDQGAIRTLSWGDGGLDLNSGLRVEGDLIVTGKIANSTPSSASLVRVNITSNSMVLNTRHNVLQIHVKQVGSCIAQLCSDQASPGQEITIVIAEIPNKTTFRLNVADMLCGGSGIDFCDLGQVVKLLWLDCRKWCYSSGRGWDVVR
jgi:hypothetical protein